MKINYGVFVKNNTPKHRNPKKRRDFKTGSIEMDITLEQWDNNDIHKEIKEKIKEKEPMLCGWHGYCIGDESIRKEYENKKRIEENGGDNYGWDYTDSMPQ
jgi:hypothetical protein